MVRAYTHSCTLLLLYLIEDNNISDGDHIEYMVDYLLLDENIMSALSGGEANTDDGNNCNNDASNRVYNRNDTDKNED